jgi:hypothetical protein
VESKGGLLMTIADEQLFWILEKHVSHQKQYNPTIILLKKNTPSLCIFTFGSSNDLFFLLPLGFWKEGGKEIGKGKMAAFWVF